jgi:predicted HTH transcriptional regulator
MPYSPIWSSAQIHERLVIGQTREDHWLDFKSALGADNRKIARDVAQFANASGGTLIFGAQESKQVFTGFNGVSDPPNVITRIDDIVKAYLTPVPTIEPHALELPSGIQLVIVNVPPSMGIVAIHEKHERFEFLIRSHESKRYMTLMEVEARMENKERAMRLRIERIPADERVGLDAKSHGITWHGWRVEAVER